MQWILANIEAGEKKSRAGENAQSVAKICNLWQKVKNGGELVVNHPGQAVGEDIISFML